MAIRRHDLSGQRFGRWVVQQFDSVDSGGGARWLCRCDCGAHKIVKAQHLRNGASTQCQACAGRQSSTTHGESFTTEYRIWLGIKARCLNPQRKEYPNYGGRGITICRRWRYSYELFLKDMGRRPGPEYSVERIDNDWPYDPDNCRWATWREQARNSRHCRWLEYNGCRMILGDWAKELGITQQALLGRFANNWSVEKALTTPNTRVQRE